ncbi:MAG: hypothetical protein M3R00_07220 [Pseudomonadota bacterium]|nr:hypothetical protein [Pseudomonadota bacterium]
MEVQNEINDTTYLDKIRAGEVTFVEVFCRRSFEKVNALNLVQAINATHTMTALTLDAKSQEPGALAIIVEGLARCPKLNHLYLRIKGKNVLAENDVDSLSQYIYNCTSLKSLDLSGMCLLPNQQLRIIQACTASRSLEEILLSGWKIAANVVPALGQLFELSSTLKSLCLHSNGLKSTELNVLLRCIERNENSVLEDLVLSSNPIGYSGLEALATGIRSNKLKLKNLALGHAGLDESCADLLFQIIHGNRHLESLSCGANQLGIRSLIKIAEAVTDNNTLVELDLHANPFLGSQRVAAVIDSSQVSQSSSQTLMAIDKKLKANKQNKIERQESLQPK